MASEGSVALKGYTDDNLGPVVRPRQEAMTKQEMGYLAVERMYECSKQKHGVLL